MTVPPILCVGGNSGSGKTHLIERLLPLLTARSLRVGTLKHAEHVDVPAAGKDSDRFGAAGATPSVVIGPDALIATDAPAEAALLDAVGTFCGDGDLILGEGLRRAPFDRILVSAGAANSGGDGRVRLVVAEGPGADFPRDDTEGVADWIVGWLERRRAMREGLIGAVLVGGQSRRMGTDKSRLVLAGRSVLAGLYELLAERVGEAWIVGRRPDAEGLPASANWHLDMEAGQGPLGGIATALRIAGGDSARGVCVVGCDMPVLGGEVLDLLLSSRDRSASATVLVNPSTGGVEPLAAIYEASALESIEQALAAERRGVRDWLADVGASRVDVPPALADQLINVNTPEEFERIRTRMEPEGT